MFRRLPGRTPYMLLTHAVCRQRERMWTLPGHDSLSNTMQTSCSPGMKLLRYTFRLLDTLPPLVEILYWQHIVV